MSYLSTLIDMGEIVSDLSHDQAKWSQETFGDDATRGPVGALKHLEEEAREAVAAVESGDPAKVREELADCLLLLLDASRRAGIKPMQLFEAGQAKMVVNKQRKWPSPTTDEPVEHIQ